ncbi:UDP-glucose 4-epimerase [Thermanaerovibrio acidaminovorans DSM 6589]|uniref:UDP-glucose 4-epimerase n=1 Tax=Thermanaerovibrio acidaminovorans (strain ATCC 49978 / DSM 6589 / Su883) TaxID=525903 RepID=D1B6K0_THEAS|nr:UDP-glucose 4-epimerase GalE [Thermanaerovibrio acidaminovorans]ACZ19641.1 UDP-glucose 4-epimerase [Thermanaerovibrio acidaminovorans DSM 6589]
MRILVTGGAGYIGSHCCVELLSEGYQLVVVDSLVNSKPEALRRIRRITGRDLEFYRGDVGDRELLERVFSENRIDAVIHFAGLKAVGESVQVPLKYYRNNVCGTVALCEAMERHQIKRMVFSSSATVYGEPERCPISEDFPLEAKSPYGRTKLMIEQILGDLASSNRDFSLVILRYFNPIGAHESGLMGEDPNGIPNNLMPYITQVASGRLETLNVFGGDYDTPDGTPIRDYIHVVDLVKGHLKALDKATSSAGTFVYNLGTGRGYSVLEVIRAFEAATGVRIPYRIVDRRPGDVPVCYADPSKALRELGWRAERTLEDMCRDSWRWQTMNPMGYDDQD